MIRVGFAIIPSRIRLRGQTLLPPIFAASIGIPEKRSLFSSKINGKCSSCGLTGSVSSECWMSYHSALKAMGTGKGWCPTISPTEWKGIPFTKRSLRFGETLNDRQATIGF